MVVRLSTSCTNPALLPRILFFLLLIFISVRGRVNPQVLVWLEGLSKLKKFSDLFGTQPATFRHRKAPQPCILLHPPFALQENGSRELLLSSYFLSFQNSGLDITLRWKVALIHVYILLTLVEIYIDMLQPFPKYFKEMYETDFVIVMQNLRSSLRSLHYWCVGIKPMVEVHWCGCQ
jgi:hypothetical protein